MNLTIPQIELLMLDSAFHRAKEYEQRCNRRLKAAAEEAQVASKAVIDLANAVEQRRRELLRSAK